MLQILLKNNTLADGVFEIQSLQDVQSSLSASVSQLGLLQQNLQQTATDTSLKKSSIEQENLNLKNRKAIIADQQSEKNQLLKETKNQEGVYQKNLLSLLQQQQALEEEINQIESNLKANLGEANLPKRITGFFVWPVVLKKDGGIGQISQNWGETAYSYLYKGKPHNGMDISAPIGAPIYAATDGRVVRTDYNGLRYQYGRYILIDHGNNLSTLYAHLSGAVVGAGETVKKGQLIGYVGSTGFITGPHLHFGVYVTPPGGWRAVASKLESGLISLPPASGLVPIGVTLNPLNYL